MLWEELYGNCFRQTTYVYSQDPSLPLPVRISKLKGGTWNIQILIICGSQGKADRNRWSQLTVTASDDIIGFQLFVVVQSLIHVWLFVTHGLQHAKLPCPSSTPWACSNSCPSGQWCHPPISSSVIPCSSCLQPFPASGYFLMSQLFTSGGQSIGASTSVLPINIQDLFPLGLIGLISLQSKEFSSVFSNTIVQKHQFFGTQLSSQSNSHIHIWPLEKQKPWLDRPLFAK